MRGREKDNKAEWPEGEGKVPVYSEGQSNEIFDLQFFHPYNQPLTNGLKSCHCHEAVFKSACHSVSLQDCLPVCLSSLWGCLTIYSTVCIVWLSFCLSVCLSISMPVWSLSDRFSAGHPVWLSLSVWLFRSAIYTVTVCQSTCLSSVLSDRFSRISGSSHYIGQHCGWIYLTVDSG